MFVEFVVIGIVSFVLAIPMFLAMGFVSVVSNKNL